MSQVIKNLASGPVPPAVPTSFVTDVNSPSIPIANIENVFGGTSTSNNNNGIQTDGSSGSNTLTVQLTNRAIGTLTTTDATKTTIISFTLGLTPGVYTVSGYIGGFIPASNAGGSYFFDSSVKTNGTTATEIGTEYSTTLEDAIMSPSDIFAEVSGNNLLIRVQGIAATTINWIAKFEYTLVN